MSMSKAELRVKMHALGLTAQQVADDIGKDIRTIQRYYSPASPLEPSEELAEYIAEKWARNRRQVAAVMDGMKDTMKDRGGPPQEVQLSAYVSDVSLAQAGHNLSRDEHDALLAQVIFQLEEAGLKYSIHYVPIEG